MVFNAACAAIATSCAIYVAVRDGRWRKTGLAAQLNRRIDDAQRAADRWHDTAPAVELKAEVDRQGKVLNAHDSALLYVATREDIAKIQASAQRVETLVEHAHDSVDRIESMLIRRALGPLPS